MISHETLTDLLQYIQYIHDTTIEKTVKENPTETELILSCSVCLQEEAWELASSLRKLTWMSFNKEKVKNFSVDQLEEEIADVFIVLLLLTKRCGIASLDSVLRKKIEKNNARWY